jgi:hypothetical protein
VVSVTETVTANVSLAMVLLVVSITETVTAITNCYKHWLVTLAVVS